MEVGDIDILILSLYTHKHTHAQRATYWDGGEVSRVKQILSFKCTLPVKFNVESDCNLIFKYSQLNYFNHENIFNFSPKLRYRK